MEAVRGMILHALQGYEQHAWGKDELHPISRRGEDTFGGLGATPVDTLDTLLLANLTEKADK